MFERKLPQGASPISRRRALGILSAGIGAAACAHPSGAPVNRANQLRIDPDNRVDNVRSYLKIISDLSEQPTFRFMSGTILAVPQPHHLGHPFLKYISIKQDRVREIRDDVFQHAYRGVTLFADVMTDEVIDVFENPFTGHTNTVEHYKTSKGSIVYSPEGVYFLRVGATPSNLISELDNPFRLTWMTHGDHVWVTYDERFQIDDEDGNLKYADNSMYRYKTSLRQVQDPSITSVEMVMNWATETRFWPWMDMDDHPGHLIFGSMGTKFKSLDELPSKFVMAAEQRLPGHLNDTIDWSDYAI